MLLTLRLWNSDSGLDFRQRFLLHEYQMLLPQARHLGRSMKYQFCLITYITTLVKVVDLICCNKKKIK